MKENFKNHIFIPKSWQLISKVYKKGSLTFHFHFLTGLINIMTSRGHLSIYNEAHFPVVNNMRPDLKSIGEASHIFWRSQFVRISPLIDGLRPLFRFLFPTSMSWWEWLSLCTQTRLVKWWMHQDRGQWRVRHLRLVFSCKVV